ncbi:MAG: hypothetical protein ACOVNU_13760 [Candidatus Kapaibacteriota bacterium]
MVSLHPQYIKDNSGIDTFVVLTANEYESILEVIEDYEDIKLFDNVSNDPNTNFIDLDKFKVEMGL